MEDPSKIKKKQAVANPSWISRGRKPYPLDANGNKIRPEEENKESVQKKRNKKNYLNKTYLVFHIEDQNKK